MKTNIEQSTSKSPLKPKLLLKYIDRLPYKNLLEIVHSFKPATKSDFVIAHTPEYIESFFHGIQPICSSNGLPWSEELVTSVCYTNASLYHAMEYASQNPDTVTFSVTSGFHHARPEGGSGFCTFSGQVIASVKLYSKYGLRTAWLDLDGHYGNSIEDSREFVPDLNDAIPLGFNINPAGNNVSYLASLRKHLKKLEKAILNKEIDCVVWAHGADSHEDDDLGGSCTTAEWIACATIFYNWVNQLNIKRGKPLPVTLTLFGGYREDDYNSVLSLHIADIVECLKILCGHQINYTPEVKSKRYRGL